MSSLKARDRSVLKQIHWRGKVETQIYLRYAAIYLTARPAEGQEKDRSWVYRN